MPKKSLVMVEKRIRKFPWRLLCAPSSGGPDLKYLWWDRQVLLNPSKGFCFPKDSSGQSKIAEFSWVYHAKLLIVFHSSFDYSELSKVVKLHLLTKKMRLQWPVGKQKGIFWSILCWPPTLRYSAHSVRSYQGCLLCIKWSIKLQQLKNSPPSS